MNQRKQLQFFSEISRRKFHLLLEFPHPELEAVVIEWEFYKPSVFIQLKKNRSEPLQFPKPPELEQALKNFINPSNGLPFRENAYLVDLVFSARSFSFLQPEPDSVLPDQALWDCRAEALSSLGIQDAPLSALSGPVDF